MAEPTAVPELAELIRALRPVRQPGEYAFRPHPTDAAPPAGAVGWFREPDGASVIVPAGPNDPVRLAWLTLTVESPLTAVGLTAAVARALAAVGIACNVVAARRHDHLFVPAGRAEEALAVLTALQITG